MSREKYKRPKPRGESTDAEHWDGPPCMSDEGTVIELEQRGWVRRSYSSKQLETLCQERRSRASCCTRDEGGPFGAVLQGKAPNRHELLRLNTVVVNVMVKRRGNDRVRYE
jgi:hypothetical protein